MSAQKSSDWTEPLLRSVVDSSPLGLFVLDNRTDAILYFNHPFCEIWGIENLEGAMRRGELNNSDIIPDCVPLVKDVTAFAESCKPLQNEENRAVVEDEVEFVDGRTIRRFSTQIRDAKDRYFGRLYIFEDVTERRRAERAVRESAERHRALVENAPICIHEIDLEGRLVAMNPAGLRMVGAANEREIAGLTYLDIVAPESREGISTLLGKAYEGQASEFEFPAATGDPPRIFASSFIPLKDESGAVLKLMGVSRDITKRKRAEEALALAHAQLETRVKERTRALAEANAALEKEVTERKLRERALRFTQFSVDCATDAIFWVDRTAKISYVSDRACQALGYSREELTAMSVHDIDPLFPREIWPEHWERIKQRRRLTIESCHRTKDGTIFPVEIAIHYLEFDGTGYSCAFARDISDRKRAEEELQRTQASLNLAVRSARVGFWDWGIRTGSSYLSPEWKQQLGYEDHEVENRFEEWESRLHPDDHANALARLRAYCEKPWPNYEAEFRLRHKDGSYRWILTHASLTTDADGKPERMLGSHIDITERKQAEEALRESEEQLRLVTDALPVCIAYTDSEQRYQFNNKTYEAWFGRSRTELKGRHIKEVLGVSAYEVIRGHVEAALSGQAVSYETSLFLGGKERHVLANYVPHVGEQGETKGYFAFVTDITQRKRAEEERQKLEAKIQHAQKLESLGVLAGGIAHDFNNLLTGVMGNAELALMEMQPESPARSYVQDVVTAAERAAQLTKEMLAYSGKGRFAVESLDLSELVEEMVHLLEVTISKKVLVKYDVAEGPLPIEADATQLRQVVMNLVTNAAEAIGDRSGSVAIRTGIMAADRDYLSRTYLDEELPEGDYAYLEVADTGCGMDRSTLERIFDPFFTTKFTGRGLGLAAALGIVRGHKGAIKIDSQPGRGTTFRMLLPSSPTVLEDNPQPLAQTAEGWRGSGVILAVDDEESVRTLVERVLEKQGFTVVTAKDGREALDVFRSQCDEIVAVVLDLTMPVMDGKETFRELSRLRPDVKVILTSGYNEQDATRQFGRRKIAGFVAKPFQPGKLIAVVRQVLEGGRRDPP